MAYFGTMRIFLVSLYLLKLSNCEYFSATEELKTLKFNNQELITVLKDFSHKIEKLQDDVKRCLEEAENEQNLMQDDLENYVHNPLYGFSLLKRLSYDVDNLKKSLNTLSGYSRKFDHIKLPMSEFSGAVEGIYRLQETYQLKSRDLATGIVGNRKRKEEFSPFDLLAIGKEMFKHSKKYSFEYLEVGEKAIALRSTEAKLKFLEELFDFYKSISSYQEAVEMIDNILKVNPSLSKYEDQRLKLELLILYKENEKRAKKQHLNDYSGSAFSEIKEKLIMAKACRGELQKSQEELSKLNCHYVSKNHFTKIAPFKLIEMNLEPYVAIFLDVISDNEMEWLKASAINKLLRASVVKQNDSTEISTERIAKTIWKADSDHEVFKKLSIRVSDMSGLNMEGAEKWIIQNYGLGGHYLPHQDYFSEKHSFTKNGGNRIATLLFYLSTVEMGGATVFPFLRIYIPAIRGSAAFWYNLSSSGHLEFLTRHSGCPVMFGSKWIANKWIRERGQEFHRPCELKPKLAHKRNYLTEYNLKDYGILE